MTAGFGAGGAVSPPPLDAPGAPRPVRPVRLVALDLDGTTLDFDQRLHPRTRDAIRAVVARGIHVVAATGRMYRSALPWALDLGLTAPLICYQGAVVRAMPRPGDPELGGVPQGRLIAEDGVDGDVALAALGVARRGGWHVQAYRDDHLLCEAEGPAADFYSRIAQIYYELVDDLAVPMAEGSTKVVCVVLDEPGAAACEAALRTALGARARVVRSMPEFVEVTNPAVSKARALRSVCAELGVALDEVVAAGDAPNDADLLAAAGFAAAVAGAHPAALAEADVVIPAPADAGVALLLEELGLTR
jgi:Cof subfamily protein (haloacid dehalogenase superfamily)